MDINAQSVHEWLELGLAPEHLRPPASGSCRWACLELVHELHQVALGSTAEARRFRGHVRVGLTARAKSATIVAMTTEALRTVRDHFSDVVDRVESQHERVMVTRNGKPAAVIISPDDLAELEERLEILSDPDAMAEIREGRDAY